ncbi:hypothetical protein [Acinetobacter kanungonis]|uniref:hypothetical protein n=1 Tax=Acinetobacter kanungonis TaxID=2699469 RepID=UPI001F240D44|nr:hypothetical protein [Acinetobacter kanungonis]
MKTKGEPVGGQLPKRTMPSVTDFNYQAKYQAAYQSLLWNIPAVAIYRLRGAAHDAIK